MAYDQFIPINEIFEHYESLEKFAKEFFDKIKR